MSAHPPSCDVVVIGAGAVGAACAFHLAMAGLNVTVVERGSVASGTTGAGEGNILVSDKPPGPELELALLSARLWREVGFDPSISIPVLARLARQAIRLFPVLERVRALRAYRGFRPYCPDHLPVIGPDPRAPGLLHACGHEGAGIGLAAATGRLIAQCVARLSPDISLAPFAPERFGWPSGPSDPARRLSRRGRR